MIILGVFTEGASGTIVRGVPIYLPSGQHNLVVLVEPDLLVKRLTFRPSVLFWVCQMCGTTGSVLKRHRWHSGLWMPGVLTQLIVRM